MAEDLAAQRNFAKWVPGLRTYYFIAPIVLCYLLIAVWPETVDPNTTPIAWKPSGALVFFGTVPVAPESRLLLIVILAGALGSFVHGATSLTTYLGNRTLVRSWTWWYWLRPLIGDGPVGNCA